MAGVTQKIGTLDGKTVLVVTAPNGQVAAVQGKTQVEARIAALDKAATDLAAKRAALTAESCTAERVKAINSVISNCQRALAAVDGGAVLAQTQKILDARIAQLNTAKAELSALVAQLPAEPVKPQSE